LAIDPDPEPGCDGGGGTLDEDEGGEEGPSVSCMSDDDDDDEGSESVFSGFPTPSSPSFSTSPSSSSSRGVVAGGVCPSLDFGLTQRGAFNELPFLTAAICDAVNSLFQAPLYADCWRSMDGRVVLLLSRECRSAGAARMKVLANRLIRGSAAHRCRRRRALWRKLAVEGEKVWHRALDDAGKKNMTKPDFFGNWYVVGIRQTHNRACLWTL